jgi:hypothetical protein
MAHTLVGKTVRATIIPKALTIDPYDGPKSFAGKARPDGRCGASCEGRNDVRRAISGHRRPDFCGFWMSLRSACGTRSTAPIAPDQNPHKCRSYGSIVRAFGINRRDGQTGLSSSGDLAAGQSAVLAESWWRWGFVPDRAGKA